MILLYYQAFFFPKAPDENGPIDKLNKITNRIGNSFILNYETSTIKDVISTAIDSLDNDNILHVVAIVAYGGHYICLAQKYHSSNFASGLVFGYSNDKLLYQRKTSNVWQTVREI